MTTDPELAKILSDFENAPKFTHDNTAQITYHEAAQAITRWAAKQELRGRIDELGSLMWADDISDEVKDALTPYIRERTHTLKDPEYKEERR